MQIQSKSSRLEILGLEHLLDQKTLRNTLTIILVEAAILQHMKKSKNLLKDQEDHLHHKNITNNKNIISHQLRDQCMMQMMKVLLGIDHGPSDQLSGPVKSSSPFLFSPGCQRLRSVSLHSATSGTKFNHFQKPFTMEFALL